MRYFIDKTGGIIQTDAEKKTLTQIKGSPSGIVISIQEEPNVEAFEQGFVDQGLQEVDKQAVHDFTNAVIAFLKGEVGFEVFDGKTNAFHIENFFDKPGTK